MSYPSDGLTAGPLRLDDDGIAWRIVDPGEGEDLERVRLGPLGSVWDGDVPAAELQDLEELRARWHGRDSLEDLAAEVNFHFRRTR